MFLGETNRFNLILILIIGGNIIIIIRDRKRDKGERFICPYGQKSNKNLFNNLRLFEPEIFLSRQAPKIILMIFHDFCSEGA